MRDPAAEAGRTEVTVTAVNRSPEGGVKQFTPPNRRSCNIATLLVSNLPASAGRSAIWLIDSFACWMSWSMYSEGGVGDEHQNRA